MTDMIHAPGTWDRSHSLESLTIIMTSLSLEVVQQSCSWVKTQRELLED